jgi:GLPGLI family protein
MFRQLVTIFILMILAGQVVAQSNYTVIYHQLNYVDSTGKNYGTEIKGALYVMNDTMTVCRYAWREEELMKKFDINSGVAHHGTLNNLREDFHYSIGHTKDSGFLLMEPIDTNKWEILPNDTMTILNKKCIAAKRSDVVAWFTPSIPLKAGPAQYFGLPGLVLAVFLNSYNITIIAEKIIPSIPEIVTSKPLSVISLADFKAMQKRIREKDEKRIRWFGQ